MQRKYGPLYENNRPISLFVTEYTWKMQQALSGQWIQLGNSTHRTKCCGKCLTCFWVTRVRRTAREAGTAGVTVWTAGTGGWKARGATHIHRLALLCNKQKWSDDIQKRLASILTDDQNLHVTAHRKQLEGTATLRHLPTCINTSLGTVSHDGRQHTHSNEQRVKHFLVDR